MTSKMDTITVNLGQRRYDIHIGHGLIDRAENLLATHLGHRRAVVVSDENVASCHGEHLISALRKAGVSAEMITVAPGEASKNFETLARVIDQILALELDRGDVIIAFGGGVIGDLAGFAAAIYKRGIDFIQIPTTLLAQVDSSVGGKTAIDTPRGKNLVGAFHQPLVVVADLDLLSTLDDRQMRAGYAEVLKCGLLGDAQLFSWLERNGAAVLAREKSALAKAIRHAVQMKADIVIEDEREQGRRALLNLGHTFAHALEAESGLGDQLLHGEAVALGCALAFRFSVSSGLCKPEQASRVEQAISQAGLPARLSDIAKSRFSADRLVAHMAQDKKAEGGEITLILARHIGEAFVAKAVDRTRLKAFLLGEGAA